VLTLTSSFTLLLQTEIEHLVKGDDGIFWMSYEDFTKYFRAVNVCMVRPTGAY
jgi:hypothetical protein